MGYELVYWIKYSIQLGEICNHSRAEVVGVREFTSTSFLFFSFFHSTLKSLGGNDEKKHDI